MPAPKVFISYSHDSIEHEDRVRALADRLRSDGIDAWIDQYAPAPSQGWPMWMQEQLLRADFAVLVCTETYLRRVERREKPGTGRGVLWEATLIYNSLYPEDCDVQKFIPVLFHDGQPSWIPLPLRGSTYYRTDDKGYEDLYRHLTCQPKYQVPPLGELRGLPALRHAGTNQSAPLESPDSMFLRASDFEQENEYSQAKHWYERAAAAGSLDAMNSLGVLYRKGLGVQQDFKQARKCYEKAAADGHALAMANLGFLYENGLGVARDPIHAREWYKKAAAAGYRGATDRLKRLNG